jgi:hypothetical protein
LPRDSAGQDKRSKYLNPRVESRPFTASHPSPRKKKGPLPWRSGPFFIFISKKLKARLPVYVTNDHHDR